MAEEKDFHKIINAAYSILLLGVGLLILTIGLIGYYFVDPNLTAFKEQPVQVAKTAAVDPNLIENGIHVRTGLKDAEGLMAVVTNCTVCHSSKLVIQNRMNAERWNKTIKWMQETQNLWDLGDNHEVIVNYLVTNYPPKKKGRRENLTGIDWYVLEN